MNEQNLKGPYILSRRFHLDARFLTEHAIVDDFNPIINNS